MKKIIHMSDPHITAAKTELGIPFGEVVVRLSQRITVPEEYVLVITGDLVDDAGDSANYHRAKEYFDALKKQGFEHILVVPGNHDYRDGSHADKRFVKIFKEIFFGKEEIYPKDDIIDEIAFIGLDSMGGELHWYDRYFGEGEVGEDQMNDLWRLLKRDDIKSCAKRVVYLHHHPIDEFPFLYLKDGYKLMEGLAGKVDAVLYGHHHMGKNFNTVNYRIPRCYDAGCVTLKPGGWLHSAPSVKVRDATRVIRLDMDPSHDELLHLSA